MKTTTRTMAFTALALTAASAFADAPITPTNTSFGTLAAATFNGTNVSSGIDNTQVAITSFSDVTLGLTATPRFANPAVTNNGNGTFYAQVGPDTGVPSYAKWNFDWYVDPGANQGPAHVFQLLYDFDPAAANLQSTHGAITLGPLLPPPAGVQWSDSWNLGMPFLALVLPGIAPPSYSPFSNTAAGEYTFALVSYTLAGAEEARVAIKVAVVPEPSTYLMLLAGLGLVGFMRRRLTR